MKEDLDEAVSLLESLAEVALDAVALIRAAMDTLDSTSTGKNRETLAVQGLHVERKVENYEKVRDSGGGGVPERGYPGHGIL